MAKIILEDDRAYIAGWIDNLWGKPQIRETRTKGRIKPDGFRFSVKTRNAPAARLLASMTGVEVVKAGESFSPEYNRKACEDHCPEKHVHVAARYRQGFFRVIIYGSRLTILLHGISDLLLRMDDFQEALDEGIQISIYNTSKDADHRGRARTLSVISDMAELGWEIPEPIVDAMKEVEGTH